MSRTPRILLALLFSAASIAPASAAVFVFTTSLDGASEVPPNASPGTGLGRVTFDNVAHTMRVETSFSGLIGTTTAAHIHDAPVGVGGPVISTLPSFTGFPVGVTSGTYDFTFDMTQSSSYSSSFLSANGGSTAAAETAFLGVLLSGEGYLNIHSNVFPGGEIRGNLTAIPEPATWALMIGGFGLAGAALRVRTKRAPVPV